MLLNPNRFWVVIGNTPLIIYIIKSGTLAILRTGHTVLNFVNHQHVEIKPKKAFYNRNFSLYKATLYLNIFCWIFCCDHFLEILDCAVLLLLDDVMTLELTGRWSLSGMVQGLHIYT